MQANGRTIAYVLSCYASRKENEEDKKKLGLGCYLDQHFCEYRIKFVKPLEAELGLETKDFDLCMVFPSGPRADELEAFAFIEEDHFFPSFSQDKDSYSPRELGKVWEELVKTTGYDSEQGHDYYDRDYDYYVDDADISSGY